MTERKTEILNAAKEIFAQRGVAQTTVRQIGAHAGILSGSLYHHFESKLDIVDAILGDFCTEVLAGYKEIAESDGDSIDRLRRMTRYALSLGPDHSAAVVILQNDSDELIADPRFAYLVAFNKEVEERWTTELRNGMKEGRLRDTLDPGLVYRIARDAILGALRWFEPTKGKPLDSLADDFADILLRGIATD